MGFVMLHNFRSIVNKMPDVESDEAVIALLRKKDPKSMNAIHKMYGRELLATVFRLVRNEEDAKDILQNFMVSLWELPPSFSIDTSLKAYLCKSARNRALNFMRDNIKRLDLIASVEDFNGLNTVVEVSLNKLEAGELATRIIHEIEKLPRPIKAVVNLSKMEGLSNMEIAHRLDLSHQTVRNRISIGLKILRLRLNDLFLLLF